MRKRILKIVGVFILVIIAIPVMIISWFLYSAHQEAKEGAPLVLDQVVIWEEKVWEREEYVLAQLITGFQDKTEEVALFKGSIAYDKWGNPIYSNVIFRDVIDQQWKEEGRGHAARSSRRGYLEFEKERIRVVFDNGEEQIFKIMDIKNAPVQS